MSKQSPYLALPNALSPQQIGQWNQYYEDYAKFAGICMEKPVTPTTTAGGTIVATAAPTAVVTPVVAAPVVATAATPAK